MTKTLNLLCSMLYVYLYAIHAISGQDVAIHGYYTEPVTNITFYTSSEPNGTVVGDGFFSPVSWGGYTWGIALPENALTMDSYDYIGLIIGSCPNGTGWSGVVQGQDSNADMPNHLMLLAWPTGNGHEIATSFRYSTGFVAPKIYNGTASITQIYTQVNTTNWLMVYKCTRCLIFDDPSQSSFNTSTSAGLFEQGWAQSSAPPDDPTNPDSAISQHNNGMGEFKVEVASAIQASYSIWATMTVPGISTSGTAQSTGTGNATSARSSTISTGTTTASGTACTTATHVAVTFNEILTTSIGQTVKVSGSIPELGNWDTNLAPVLSATQYTPSNHLWTYTAILSAGDNFQYKFINVQSSGTIDWESDPNRSFIVPESCATAVTINDAWR